MRGARPETRSLQVRFQGSAVFADSPRALGSGLALDALKDDTDRFDLVAVVETDPKQLALSSILSVAGPASPSENKRPRRVKRECF